MSSSYYGGSGTVYLSSPGASTGHLVVKGRASPIPDASTPMRRIGRHVISSVENLGNQRWRITRGPDSGVYQWLSGSITDTGTGSVAYHRFTLTQPRTVRLDYRSTTNTGHAQIFRDDGSLDASDLIMGNTFGTNTSFNLPAGSFVMALSRPTLTVDEAVVGQNNDGASTGSFRDYTILLQTLGGTWHTSVPDYDWGLDGMQVSLDAANPNAPLYTIVSNTEESITVETLDNLSSAAGKELIGVQTYETVNITGGAKVDFGGDRVVVNDWANSNIDTSSKMKVGLLRLGTTTFTKTNRIDADKIIVDGNVLIDGAGSYWTSSQAIEVNGNLTVKNNVALFIQSTLIVRGDLRLENAGRIQPGSASGVSLPLALDVTVTGTLAIDATSSLNASDMGYPSNWSGPEHTYQLRYSCYGGKRNDYLNPTGDCTYGDYRRVRFPGSGGQSTAGGGLITLKAGTLDIAGSIQANSTSGDGAGGGIQIEVDVLRGSGTIEASGIASFNSVSTTNYRIPGGGRVAIVARDRSGFTGNTQAYGGVVTSRQQFGGAGTVYLTSPGATTGHLVVKGHNSQILDASTPMRGVGRHVISSVENLGNQRWRITRGPDSGVYQWLTGSITDTGAGSVAYHRFTLTQPRTVRLDYRSTTNTGHAQIFRDDGSLDTSDLITGNTFGTNTSFNLPAGSFVIALSRPTLTVDEAVAGQNNDGASTGSFRDYTILLQTLGGTWHTSALDYDWGLDGMQVSLDAANLDAPLYTIVSNTEEAFTVESPDNLSSAAGKELIGVQMFETVNITGGAKVDFGDDQLVIRDMSDSVVDGLSKLHAGRLRLPSLALANKTTRYDIDEIIVDGDMLIDGGNVSLYAKNGVRVGGMVNLLNYAALTVSGTLQSQSDVNLFTSAYITVPYGTATAVYPLTIEATGNIFVDTTARIDVANKGYYGNYISGPDFTYDTGRSCYGGLRFYSTAEVPVDCTYGRYNVARFPGSAGSSYAGGQLTLRAAGLYLNGSIKALGNAGTYGGAGGGVHIDVGIFTGIGSIDASGGGSNSSSTWGGGGGRISILSDSDTGFTGTLLAKGFAYNANVAGAGTVFKQRRGNSYGALTIDNVGSIPADGSTPIRAVGRRVITQATNLGNQQWRIATSGDGGIYEKWSGSITNSGAGSVRYHRFTLNAARKVRFNYRGNFSTSAIQVFKADGSLSAADLVVGATISQGLKSELDLPAGNLIVAFGRYPLTVDEAVAGSNNDYPEYGFGDYRLLAETFGGQWHASDAEFDWGLDGMQVSLDAGDPSAPLYTIVSNNETSFIVQSSADLSSVVGKETIGVHTLESLVVDRGARVSFGGDRLHVVNAVVSRVGSNAMLEVGGITSTTAAMFGNGTGQIVFPRNTVIDSLNITGGKVEFRDTLTVTGNFQVGGTANVTANTINAQHIVVDAATLTASKLQTAGNILVLRGGVITVPYASSTTRVVYPLSITAAGTVEVDVLSKIDLKGRGYTANYWSGPDFTLDTRRACHAGKMPSASGDCTYGRYDLPRFAGSAGYSGGSTRPGRGGGAVSLQALELRLDGQINADGEEGATNGGGAGGSVLIQADTLRGAGSVSALGGLSFGNSSYNGSGGRVSIQAADRSLFAGTHNARSYGAAGSGTVYLHGSSATYGELRVDNGGAATSTRSTPVRSVGRHAIASITSLGNNRWKVAKGTDSSLYEKVSGTLTASGAGSIAYHRFSLTAARTMRFATAAQYTLNVLLFRDDGTLTTDDWIIAGLSPNTVALEQSLAAGNYIAVVGVSGITVAQAVAGTRTNTSYGPYQMNMQTILGTWKVTDTTQDWGLQDLWVSLNAADINAPLYRVAENREEYLVVESAVDLSAYSGKDLIGVQTLQRLRATGGANLSFGADRVIVNDTAGSIIDGSSTVEAAPGSVLP